MGAIVKILNLDTHKKQTKEFHSASEALDYVFESLGEEPCELCRVKSGEYSCTVVGRKYIEYRILLEE